ncbi:ROK family protein [Microbacterium betulae]|uniref:ROK family protein n=1 Tax=Microbacterium betulae TaxID=2981139 RepID=A0AA97FHK2_9MICO|nr:ROK family protein [Microbacterium sp. AB]WOF23023.1 ROK family protein [Microbacterium sp. AB]
MTRIALAVDLGGTKVEAALVDGDGAVVTASRNRQPTGPELTPDRLRSAVADVVSRALAHLPEGAEFVGAGIGSAGPIDLVEGTIRPVNLRGVHGFGLVEAVRDAVIASTGQFDPTVRLRHDGGCLALAESWIGAAAGARASLSFVVSTGVGGGIVIDGRAIGGASGNAGHLGQMHVGELTVEEISSGPSSVRWAQLQGWHGETGEDLARASARGDRIARAAIERSAKTLGQALADASSLLDLEVIAVSGGFSAVSDDYVDLVAGSLREWAVLPYAQRTRVVRSALGGDGPIIGAAALVLRG